MSKYSTPGKQQKEEATTVASSYAKQCHIETFENETGYGAQFVTGQGGQGGRDEEVQLPLTQLAGE